MTKALGDFVLDEGAYEEVGTEDLTRVRRVLFSLFCRFIGSVR